VKKKKRKVCWKKSN